MLRLALHWQILIGMLAGTLIGLVLNMTCSTRSVEIAESSRLPKGIVAANIDDSSASTRIRYTNSAGTTIERTIDPVDRSENVFPSVEMLAQSDPIAVQIYERHGQSLAKRVGAWFSRLGGLFLRMLQMVAVPLIVTSLMTGVIGLGSSAGIGRMFRRTIVYYLCTSMLAITTGLFVVNVIRPGLRGEAVKVAKVETSDAASLVDVLFAQLEAMIPKNPLSALVAPNYLSIIAFTIAFSLFTISVGGRTQDRIGSLATAGFEVMMAMTMAIIRLAPVGVFFLIAAVTATQGANVFMSLAWYVVAVASALSIHALITLPLIVKFVARRSPFEFAKAMSPALLTAFSSASSNGTLPLTMSSVEERAGISNRTGSFVLPLGATINMDGTALYEAVAVIFIAQLHFGMNLPLSQQIVVAITALLASVGAAGIPHAGLVMMAIILHAVGLPMEMQGVILAVDRVLDMARTAVNVWSDSCGCAVVEALEGNDASFNATTDR
ncbi:dicarboxylate/amino acid:cation symporter [Novipirellula artificiosorum]|uniref:Proton/sodium-glutamate symport protein n=1 Tax=Novipirellula artificiosorum TaxID=2528016 RepID=A0A5C6DLK6_9BACT|nr:dicarboxylate/amino acid:cation symporter [Novipirellula artificiosorum]TWU37065.1 Proton/sodium-glutamate symport protein [Novipirellula artificiosorum]